MPTPPKFLNMIYFKNDISFKIYFRKEELFFIYLFIYKIIGFDLF
jgi:hypothetical protein